MAVEANWCSPRGRLEPVPGRKEDMVKIAYFIKFIRYKDYVKRVFSLLIFVDFYGKWRIMGV